MITSTTATCKNQRTLYNYYVHRSYHACMLVLCATPYRYRVSVVLQCQVQNSNIKNNQSDSRSTEETFKIIDLSQSFDDSL